MNKKRLLYVASFFTLFTFLGHSVGTLVPRPPVSEAIGQAMDVMNNSLVEMPIGSPRSLGQMYYGGNVMISLYLLVSGLFFVLLAKPGSDSKLLLINSVSLTACAVFSAIFYFPVPAICTGLAAIAGFAALRRGD